jgi:hypothetical protein
VVRYRKRPIVIEATQWFKHGDHDSVLRMMGNDEFGVIPTIEGRMYVQPGDWIITGINGEHYPCKDDIFRKTYEAVE